MGGWTPALDLYEEKDNLIVKTELPGMKKEDINISLHGDLLTISGERKFERKNKKEGACRSERFEGRFNRVFTLPATVNADKITASYANGILTIALPKAEEAKPKQIPINVK
jgi:HSP20 family protein